MNLWGYTKNSNTHVIRIPDGEVKKTKAEKVIKDIMAESFPKLANDTNLQIQKAEQIPTRINLKKKKIFTKTHHSQTSEN